MSDAIEYDWRVVYVDQRERELHDTGPMNEDDARAFMRAAVGNPPDYVVRMQRRPVAAWEDVDPDYPSGPVGFRPKPNADGARRLPLRGWWP